MARLGERLGAGSLYGDGIRLLRYGRGVDNSRLRAELGYEPRYDAVAAIRDFATADRGGRLFPAPGVGSVLDRLAGAARSSTATRSASIPALGDRASCAASAAPSTAASTRSPPPRRPADLPKTLRDAIERMARRMRGDYHEDEWGFDEEFAEATYPFFEFLYELVAGRGDGGRNVPAHGRALLVSNHAGSIFPFDASMITGGDHEGAPAAPLAPLHGPRLGVLAAVPVRLHAPGRRGSRQPLQRHPAPRGGRADDGLPGGREGDRQAVRGALSTATVRARRIRRGRPAHGLADRPGRGRRLRGDLSEDRRQLDRSPARSARRSCRSRRPSPGSGRWG